MMLDILREKHLDAKVVEYLNQSMAKTTKVVLILGESYL